MLQKLNDLSFFRNRLDEFSFNKSVLFFASYAAVLQLCGLYSKMLFKFITDILGMHTVSVEISKPSIWMWHTGLIHALLRARCLCPSLQNDPQQMVLSRHRFRATPARMYIQSTICRRYSSGLDQVVGYSEKNYPPDRHIIQNSTQLECSPVANYLEILIDKRHSQIRHSTHMKQMIRCIYQFSLQLKGAPNFTGLFICFYNHHI